MCLRGKRPDTAGDNTGLQMIDRSFLSRLPTQSTNHLNLNKENYSLETKEKRNHDKKLIKLNHHGKDQEVLSNLEVSLSRKELLVCLHY